MHAIHQNTDTSQTQKETMNNTNIR